MKTVDPDVLFLSEVFTSPARQYGLAKLSFTQSYSYFTWRTTKWELTEFGKPDKEPRSPASVGPTCSSTPRHPSR